MSRRALPLLRAMFRCEPDAHACWPARNASTRPRAQCRKYDYLSPCNDTRSALFKCPHLRTEARRGTCGVAPRGRSLWLLGNSVNREQYFSLRRARYDSSEVKPSSKRRSVARAAVTPRVQKRRALARAHAALFCRTARVALLVFQPGLTGIGARLASARAGDIALVSGGTLGLRLNREKPSDKPLDWRAQLQAEAREARQQLTTVAQRGVHVAWLAATPLCAARDHLGGLVNSTTNASSIGGAACHDGAFGTPGCVEEANALIHAEMTSMPHEHVRFLQAERHLTSIFPATAQRQEGWCLPSTATTFIWRLTRPTRWHCGMWRPRAKVACSISVPQQKCGATWPAHVACTRGRTRDENLSNRLPSLGRGLLCNRVTARHPTLHTTHWRHRPSRAQSPAHSGGADGQ